MVFKLRNPFHRRRRRVRLAHERKPTSLRMRVLVRSLLATVLLAATVVLFPFQVSYSPSPILEGTVAPEEIVAPFSFDVPKPTEELERERARVAEMVLPVFVEKERLPNYGGILRRLERVRGNSSRLSGTLDSLGIHLKPATLRLLAAPDSGRVLLREARRVLEEVRVTGLVSKDDAGLVASYNRIRVSGVHGEEIISAAEVMDPARLAALALERGSERLGSVGGKALVDLVSALAVPDLAYDPRATEADRAAARASVSPVRAHVEKGERIVGAHERITRDQMVVLQALRQARIERAASRGWMAWITPVVGRVLLLAVMLTLFAMFLRSARRKVWDDLGLLTVVALVFLITLALAAVVARSRELHPFLVPIPMAAVILSLLVGDLVAMATVAALTGLVGAVTGWGLPVTLVGVVGGVIAVFAVHNIFQRWEFIRAIGPIALGMVATLLGVTMVGGGIPGSNLLAEIGWTVGGAILSIGLGMFLLPLFERTFHLASNITLLELSDLNRPIFKRMMIEANGTYHHSMVVGSLAEAAAEAIGANPLLARVGGYYHDIGKIAKSAYFGENLRAGMQNPHEKLTPTMSSLILESHVREGLELARAIGLPKRVADFIPEHQGTTLMQYFYNKAMEQDPEVDERDYRYPGPKPQSKETAIVMLADTAEATVRSLDDPTPNKIRATLAKMFEARIADGQLDESGLSLSDLPKIRDAFTHVLSGVYHGRVKYQWQKEGGEDALEGGREERVFHPELETAIGTGEAPGGAASPPQEVGRVEGR